MTLLLLLGLLFQGKCFGDVQFLVENVETYFLSYIFLIFFYLLGDSLEFFEQRVMSHIYSSHLLTLLLNHICEVLLAGFGLVEPCCKLQHSLVELVKLSHAHGVAAVTFRDFTDSLLEG